MSNSCTGLNVNLHTYLIISYLLKQNELLMYLRFARVATSNSEWIQAVGIQCIKNI